MTGAIIRRTLAIGTLALSLALVAVPASAQSGQVKGKVVDAKGQPIEGAKVTIANVETSGRKLETKTNKKGEYIQIGLQPGHYTITVEKGDLKDTKDVQIHLDMAQLDFTLAPGQGTASKEDQAKAQAKNAAIQKAFGEGVELSNQNKNDEAIAKFQEVIASVPKCVAVTVRLTRLPGRTAPSGVVSHRVSAFDPAAAACTGTRTGTVDLAGTVMTDL